MFNDTITIYIDDISIRLMVSQGQRVKIWADVQLEPGLVKGSVVVQEVEVAKRIKKLLRSQKVGARNVTLGFSGLHSLTRPASLPLLPRAMLPEAVAREARRVLPVPLDQLYLSWRTLPSSKGRIQVFMVATPRKTADSLVKTLHLAGLEPRHMAIKPMALTKVVPDNTAIIVDVQPTEYDIIIMADGIAQPIRTVPFPELDLPWEKMLGMISSDLDRTIKFFNTNNPEKPLAPRIPVYVSGELSNKPEFQKALSGSTGHPVVVLSSVLRSPEQMSLSRYMVNVAMATKNPSPIRGATFPVSNLNVLPAPYLPKPMSFTRIIGIPAGVAFAGAIAAMVMLMQNASANIDSMQKELDTVNIMINQKQSQQQALKKNIADLEKKVLSVKTTSDNLKSSLDMLTQRRENVNGDLVAALALVPEAIKIEVIMETDGILGVEGKSTNEQEILTYARTLDRSGRFKETVISSLIRVSPAKEETDFHYLFKLVLNRKG